MEKKEKVRCKAKSKQSGEQCKRYCAPGKTVCCIHGGKSNGPPKGSKNALKTGLYEKIQSETLFPEEIEVANSVEFDPIKTLEDQIRFLHVKELRIAKRMKQALIAEQEAGQSDGKGGKKPKTVLLTVSTIQTENFEGSQSKSVTSSSETHEMHYLRLEAAHTAVLNEIRRAVNNLNKLMLERSMNEENSNNESGVLISPGLITDAEWEKLVAEK